MRLAPLLALLLAAPALHAQQCTPDFVSPSEYYPLHVGDEWVYHVPASSVGAEAHVQRLVLREETVSSRVYAVDQLCFTAVSDGALTCRDERLVRLSGGTLLERTADGEHPVFEGLGAPLGYSPLGTCAADLGTGPVVIGGIGYTVARVKSLSGYIDFGPPPFAAGVGPVGIQVGNLAERTDRFEYARVGGVEYGLRPAAAGPDPTPAAAYAPLAVGMRREYRLHGQDGPTTGYRRETVVRDTVIAGTAWHVRRDQTFSADRARTSDTVRLARFDAASANVLERPLAPGSAAPRYPCRLDLDLTGDGVVPCSPGVSYSKRPALALPGIAATVASFGYDSGSVRVAAGLGLVSTVEGSLFTDLVYASTPALTAGMPIAGLPFRPDLTPPQDYFPLDVGNEWIYHTTENSPYGVADTYRRRRVLREETLDGLAYAVDQTCTLNLRDAAPAWACGTERRLRFDPATTDVVQSIAPGVTRVLICRLGADFDAPLPDDCDAVGYRGVQPASVTLGGTAYPVPSVKVPLTLANVPPPALIAGIGPGVDPVGAFQTSTFEYARVRGAEYGVRPAVAGEAAAPSAGGLALTAGPNPTSGVLRLTLAVPDLETVTVEAFDALGRRVWQQSATLAAATLHIDIDASAWAPGVYVVRATAGEAQATARIVRR